MSQKLTRQNLSLDRFFSMIILNLSTSVDRPIQNNSLSSHLCKKSSLFPKVALLISYLNSLSISTLTRSRGYSVMARQIKFPVLSFSLCSFIASASSLVMKQLQNVGLPFSSNSRPIL